MGKGVHRLERSSPVRQTITFIIKVINYRVVPADGCNAISTEGICFRTYVSTVINWADSRAQCVSRGYDLSTITSLEEDELMYSTFTTSSYCWIGLEDIDNEGTYVWVDGSDSTFTYWAVYEPNNVRNDEDCVHTKGQPRWNDLVCTGTLPCYSCGTKGNPKNIKIL